MTQDEGASRWFTLPHAKSLRARVSALGEPMVVILGGTLLARIVLRRAGLSGADQFLFREGSAPDFLAAAKAEGIWHGLRYGLIIVLALLIGGLRGRRSPASYGVSLGGQNLVGLIGMGVVLGLLVSLPVQILHLVHEYVSLGSDTPFWALKDRVVWGRDFWIYMAVGSFLVVPFVEEFTARGYVLGRLRESYSPGATLFVMAVFFALAHGQYHRAEILATGQLVSLVIFSVVFGYAVYRTGSLIPVIVAHGILNVPLGLSWRYIVLAMTLSALFLFRRETGEWLKGLWRLLLNIDDWIAMLLAVGLIAG
jgi:membrane protease YdiL (CAAX protease family)